MIFVEFKKFGYDHKVGVIASHVIQYEEASKMTRTNIHQLCVVLTMIDGRTVFVDEKVEDVAKAIDNARRLELIETRNHKDILAMVEEHTVKTIERTLDANGIRRDF